MKSRNILALLLALCLICTLAACGGSSLTGKYVIVDITDDPDGLTLDDLDALYKEIEDNIENYVYMDFHDGKAFTLVLFGEVEASGSYTLKGKDLTLTTEGEAMTAEISGKKITWIYENGAKLVFEKK